LYYVIGFLYSSVKRYVSKCRYNPAYLAGANVIAALTNIPLDRAVKKTNNVVQATSQDLETWERLALLGGWQDWEIGVDEEKPENKPQPIIQPKKIDKTKPVTF
jgi:hypothetical protein